MLIPRWSVVAYVGEQLLGAVDVDPSVVSGGICG